MKTSSPFLLCSLIANLVFTMNPSSSAQIQVPPQIRIGPRLPGRPPVAPARPGRPDPDQVCPALLGWLQILQREYPAVDLAHTLSGKLQQMAVPLFADEAFQKQFGVSYLRLSDADRRDFFRMRVIPCQTSRQYTQPALGAFNQAFQPGNSTAGPMSPGQLIPALGRLQAARSTLRADEQSLQAAAASAETYDQVMSLENKRKDELARVWPSEKTRFEAVVKQTVGRSAGAAIDGKIQPLLTASASPAAIAQLQDAPHTYAALFQAMSAEQREALTQKIDDRRSAILREMLPPQQARAKAFPPTEQGLANGAEWYQSYKAVFLAEPALPEAKTLAKSYLAQREATLAQMAPQFRKKIDASQDADAVGSMFEDVFRLPDDRQTDTYRQLSTARTARAELLTKRVEQQRQEAEAKLEKAAMLRGEIVASSLKVANLQNGRIYKALYIGNFAHAGIDRSSLFYEGMLDEYLQHFGTLCAASLPADSVQMSEPECDHWIERTTYNRFGPVSTSDQCLHWSRRPLSMKADPRAMDAKIGLEGFAERNATRAGLEIIFRKDPLAAGGALVGDMAQQVMSLQQDMPRLIEQNGCSSKVLGRLQENMTRFARVDDPVHIAGFVPNPKLPRAADLNSRNLADDLISANASGWFFNRYTGLRDVEIGNELDPEGRPRHIKATYDQKGILDSGSVDIAFVDGVPSCLYFSDDPGNCKPPSPSVVKRYENGEYTARKSH